MIFSTKAKTLIQLKDCLQTGQIANLACLNVTDWQRNPTNCLASVQQKLGETLYVVRSSCSREDSLKGSNAGMFLSLEHVAANNLKNSIDEVFESYGALCSDDEVLIQPMLQDVVRSGVMFSHDPSTCAPYRTISWFEGTDTTVVTGGKGGRTWQQAAESPRPVPPELAGAMLLLDELIALFLDTPIDCEFAITRKAGTETVWLLQVRPLILSRDPQNKSEQTRLLQYIHQAVARGMRAHPFLVGGKTVYGVMPDWNPAEIIGVRPKPLALSLYRDLVTDAIWAYQRHNYGYRNLRSFPLMPHFMGLPYIDVRISFNSFIPADLEDGLAGRLVDYYIECLLAEPALHDKVEFEIVLSCYALDLPQQLKKLKDAGFTDNECQLLSNSLRQLTNRVVDPYDGLWRIDAEKLDILNNRREIILSTSSDLLECIYWLLEDAKRYGTLPFAGLARAGFMAVQILRSLVTVGVFSEADHDAFLASVSTVGGQMSRDRSTLDRTGFLARYGHLRPGTYDILSPRYDEAPDLYFDWRVTPQPLDAPKPFALTLSQMRELNQLLRNHGLHPDPVGLLSFIEAGIKQRELAKFHFTRNLSDTLSLLSDWGDRNGFSKEDIAYADIGAFREAHVTATDVRDLIARSIEQGQSRYAQTLSLSLPPLISEPDDVWAFVWPESVPNFITQKQVTARIAPCEAGTNLNGAIVCIPNADPGFDWLLAHPIAGFITAWGGPNSHMAIRAGELGLPAVIGAGESLYRQWAGVNRLHVDCAGRRVEVLE
jgi:hypothetical protein